MMLVKYASKNQNMNMDPVQLVADVTSLVLPKTSEHGLRLLTEYHFPLPTNIEADALGIRQVLASLCDQAIRHAQRGNVVLLLAYDAGTAQLKFCIRDRANAGPSQQARELFDLFERAARYGADLVYRKVNDASGEYILSVPATTTGQVSMIENAEQLAARQQLVPLPSALADEGPEFDEVIDQFVYKLPEMLAAIEAAYLAGEYRRVFELVHNLKGMGGGFGYPQLTELAVQIESLSDNANYADIASLIAALHKLVHRIRAARTF